MSGVNNVTFSYQEYKAYVKNNKDFRLANRTYSMELGNSAGDGRVLANSSYRDTKTGASYRLTAAYDENFSADTPYMKVTAEGADQRKQEFIINIDEIDVNAASDFEMFALCSYADAHEKKTEGAKSSWDMLNTYVHDALSEAASGQEEGFGQKRDWLAMVEEEKETCMASKLYGQVADGNKLVHLLETYGMPKEVEMLRVDANTLIPVDNAIYVQDLDGGYAQMQFDSKGEITYVNHLNKSAGWSMKASHEMLEKARNLGSEFAFYMSDQSFWESYLNGSKDAEALKAAMDYQTIRSEFLNQLPESVRQAWEKAAEEAGTDGLGIDEEGALLYPSEYLKQYLSALMSGESTRICGDTVESVLEFAKTALSHLKDSSQPKYSTALQDFKDQERRFYQKLIGYLDKTKL
ncbi:hypothetical protein C804_00777 [Lachnospiraceae bacterium A4]|nr:hypothetical protein C804_00777 [Lachnospiraceae bacterium A4]